MTGNELVSSSIHTTKDDADIATIPLKYIVERAYSSLTPRKEDEDTPAEVIVNIRM